MSGNWSWVPCSHTAAPWQLVNPSYCPAKLLFKSTSVGCSLAGGDLYSTEGECMAYDTCISSFIVMLLAGFVTSKASTHGWKSFTEEYRHQGDKGYIVYLVYHMKCTVGNITKLFKGQFIVTCTLKPVHKHCEWDITIYCKINVGSWTCDGSILNMHRHR